jgi:chorismate-pyruvate lyase
MGGAVSRDDSEVKIEQLLEQFYGEPPGVSQLGEFCSVDAVPAPYDALLDHNSHMTVTVESHYGEPVEVVVHRAKRHQNWYSREITLQTRNTKKVVQYGIVRLNIDSLEPQVWRRIESQEVPLGRVLIEHQVLREVQLCELWRVQAGSNLAGYLGIDPGTTLYGRTALIYCDGEPAIELLEIVTPTGSESG